MDPKVFRIGLLFLFIALMSTWFPLGRTPDRSTAAAIDWQTKVDDALLGEIRSISGDTVDFIIFLEEQADLRDAASLQTKEEKGTYVFNTLRDTTKRTQEPILKELEQKGVTHRSYWVANMIWVQGDEALLRSLALRPEVAHIYANSEFDLNPPENEVTTQSLSSPRQVEWNIALVNAPPVWAAGYTGQGVVIGGQDTGYAWEHPALITQYRGWTSTGVDHNYNWHDAIHSPLIDGDQSSLCEYGSTEPCDDHNHGTHTMGTMVGDDGLGNQIGMAPGAQWIGCRNMDKGWGTPVTYSECFEWFIAPYPVGGSPEEGDPSRAPHVINNSWGCPPGEGCIDPNILKTVVENTRAAGIVVVASAGNSGPLCGTVNTPAGIYESVFSVGATGSSNLIASFSSRGPVDVDGSSRSKPDISAPGVGIRSSLKDGGYSEENWSGTSMASPHVAGLVALLISADPSLAGKVDEIEDLIRRSALQLPASQNCGEADYTASPNYTYGWGRIDALEAINLVHHVNYRQFLPGIFHAR